jgi:hypothetical protein
MFMHDAIRARIPAAIAGPGAQPRAGRAGSRPGSGAGTLRRVCAAVASRHDTYARRELAAQHERLAQPREVGGDFSVLP